MRLSFKIATLAALAAIASPGWSETARMENGSDTFISGDVVSETLDAGGDAFVAARTAVARGTTVGDLHVAGFDVTVGADTSDDLYAAGANVVISGSVAQDTTAAGFSVRTEPSAATGGNARLFANSLTIEGPVGGALMATAQDIILNAPIAGDARLVGRSITFGPNAVINGTLTYSAETEIAVPERVAPAARVVFEDFSSDIAWREFDDMRKEFPVLPTVGSMIFGFVISLLFFVALGALVLGFMPNRLSKMRKSIAAAPGQSILLGIIGLSILCGMVPITAMTIVGIPFVPIAILAIVLAWTLGYALGAYSVAMRIWSGFGGDPDPSKAIRLLVYAAAIVFVALLNFIPFVGWVINYTLVLLGIGAMTHATFQYFIGNPGQAFDIDMKPIDD